MNDTPTIVVLAGMNGAGKLTPLRASKAMRALNSALCVLLCLFIGFVGIYHP